MIVKRPLSSVVLLGPAWPVRGGISLFNDCLKKALESHGVNVTMAGFSRQYPDILFPGKTQFVKGIERNNIPVGKIDEILIDTVNPLTWLKAGKQINSLCPDVVLFSWWHIWFLPCYFFLLHYLKQKKIKSLFLCHNLRSHGSSSIEDGIVHGLLSGCDGIIFLSRHVRNMWKEKSPPVVSLFHPVYDFTHLVKVKVREHWCGRLLFAGYGKSYKGLKLALALLSLDGELRLTVAGEFYSRSLLKLLEQAAVEYGKRLEIIPEYVSDERLIALMDAHDMVLCPYTEATQSGMAAFAMGRERPVAATPAGGLPEQILPGAGCVSERISALSFYGAVQRIYRRTPLEWHRNIQSMKANLSWTVFVTEFYSTVSSRLCSQTLKSIFGRYPKA